jgi:hypothetical protein
MDAMIAKAAILTVLLSVAAPVSAQIRSSSASVTLHARVEESASIKAFAVSVAGADRDSTQPNLVALHVLLDWRLRNARVYRVGYGLEEDDRAPRTAQRPGLFSLRQLEAKAAAFAFMSAGDQPALLGAWGNTDQDPTGAASFLLAVPSGRDAASSTVRITIAVF